MPRATFTVACIAMAVLAIFGLGRVALTVQATEASYAANQLREDIKAERRKIKNEVYEAELARLQVELVKLQKWIQTKGLKVVILFEGRDAAGKGGAIKRITQNLNPRVCTVVALEAGEGGRAA